MIIMGIILICMIFFFAIFIIIYKEKHKSKNRNRRYYDEELVRESINNSPIVQDMLNNSVTFIGEKQHPENFKEDK